jgi:hypothetical protein
MKTTTLQFPEDDPNEYNLPNDEKRKEKPVRYQRPDTSEYMMKQAGHKSTHEYYNERGYQYGKRKKK